MFFDLTADDPQAAAAVPAAAASGAPAASVGHRAHQGSSAPPHKRPRIALPVSGQYRGAEAAPQASVLEGEPPFRLTSKPPRHQMTMDPSVNQYARRLRHVLDLRDVESVVLCNYVVDLGVRPSRPPVSAPPPTLRPLAHRSDTHPSIRHSSKPTPSACAEGKQPRLLRARFIC